MNKMLKLPLFLGIAGAACAGVLAGVYSVTQPIVQKNQAEAAAEAYVSMYSAYGVELSDVVVEDAVTLSDDLYNAGCSGRAIVEKADGVAYTCEVTGFGGKVKFQVAFAEGKYIGYTNLANSETPSYGGKLIEKITEMFKGKPSADSNALTPDVYSGTTVTGAPVATAIEVCRVDYLAWYAENK